jgi:ethanolaminephosphotransferase
MGGGHIWQKEMLPTLGIKNYSFIPEFLYKMQFNEWWMVYGGAVLIFNTISR